MEIITSFLTANPMIAIFVPIIIVLFVVLLVISKSRSTKVIEQDPVAPVTTTAKPETVASASASAVSSVSSQEPTPAVAPVPEVVQTVMPAVEVAPVPKEEVAVVGVAPAPSWRPKEPEAPAPEELVSSPVEQKVEEPVIASAPAVADTISPQALATEVIDESPVVQKETTPTTPTA